MTLLTGCGPLIPPSDNDVNRPVEVDPGALDDAPDRPKGVPDNAYSVSLHVVAMTENTGQHIPGITARVTINATSQNAPPGANVHGLYPFNIYTRLPYTHHIWIQPGIVVHMTLSATADPILIVGEKLECSLSKRDDELHDTLVLGTNIACVTEYTTT